MENTIETTLKRYCPKWGIVEAHANALFSDFSICAEECANYSKEFNTCIDFAETTLRIRQLMKKEG